MVLSPLVGFGLAYLAMVALLWGFRRAQPGRANRHFRRAQIGSAALMSFGHGTQDAQKTMGVITLALVTSGHLTSFHVPIWVVLASAAAISAGTYAGGWRIMRTMGRRIIHLTPADGVTAQTIASSVMLEHRVRLRGAGIDHARDHLVGDGRGRDQATVRGALGRGPLDRRGLGVHDPGGGRRGRGGLPAQLEPDELAQPAQVPTISTVWSTSTNPSASATWRVHRSTSRPSISTVRPQSRQTRWWWCPVPQIR